MTPSPNISPFFKFVTLFGSLSAILMIFLSITNSFLLWLMFNY
jgi:hypothetical protein